MDAQELRQWALQQAAHDLRGSEKPEVVVKRAGVYYAFLLGAAQLAETETDSARDRRLLGELSYSTAVLIRRAAFRGPNGALLAILDRAGVAMDEKARLEDPNRNTWGDALTA